jgi:hypothetical protein
MPTSRRPIDRRLFWTGVAVWAVASWLLGDAASQHMKWRINALEAIPGAGMIVRTPDGVFYHVNGDEKATVVYAPPNDHDATADTDAVSSLSSCGDCTLVTGEQLATYNEFCAAGTPSELPHVIFEVPCKSWAPINEGPKVMTTVIFLVPILILPLLRMIFEASGERRRKAVASRPA